MKSKTLLLAISVLLVSGCVLPNVDSGSNIVFGKALEITKFEATPASVSSGNTIRIEMEVENLGEVNVGDEKAMVYLTGSNLDIDKEDKIKVLNKQLKPGDKKTWTWSFDAPDFDKGQTKTQIYLGRIYHEYKTNLYGNLWVYTDSEAETLKNSGLPLQMSSFDVTNGPLDIDVTISPHPIVVYDDKTFSFTMNIRKIGSGDIYKSKTMSYKGEVTNIDPSNLNVIVVRRESNDKVKFKNGCTGVYNLIGGKEITLSCEVEIVDELQTASAFPFEMTVEYGYMTEKSTSITVKGK